MKVPHPIPYQGSKRNIANFILHYFPQGTDTLIEPFSGSAAMSIAAAWHHKANRFSLNDLNQPLIALWREIINQPQQIIAQYAHLWTAQQANPRQYYDWVRDQFNQTHRPDYLLYLLARCVKASVRYNPKGEFNQSPDNRRLGRTPERMAQDIKAVSSLFGGRSTLTSTDYQIALERATRADLIYMDPPYQGVCSGGDPRYYQGVEFADFMLTLRRLNERGIAYILSYDGRTGEKTFGRALPQDLNLHRIEVWAGRSSQATLLGDDAVTIESIYLSPVLLDRLDINPDEVAENLNLSGAAQLAVDNFRP